MNLTKKYVNKNLYEKDFKKHLAKPVLKKKKFFQLNKKFLMQFSTKQRLIQLLVQLIFTLKFESKKVISS